MTVDYLLALTWISSVAEDLWLVPVGEEVLDVSHLVVSSDQILHIWMSAHLDTGNRHRTALAKDNFCKNVKLYCICNLLLDDFDE